MRIVVVDDEQKYVKLIEAAFQIGHHQTWGSFSAETAKDLIKEHHPHLVISDINMPGKSGLDLLQESKEINPELEFIMVTANSDAQTAVKAMKLGAFEYVTKPFEMDELVLLGQRIEEKLKLTRTTRQLEQQLQDKHSFDSIIGNSPPLQQLFELMDKVKDLETTVLIRGQSGTGKELVAKSLHYQSNRSKGPFIAVNCAAIPENLIESTLFGHKKGSFTGADRDKEGLCAAADGGTLFLDEIGELPPETQSKFLRVLQEREFTPVGESASLPMSARVICATNVNLEEAVTAGEFREDLFHRLNVFPLAVPPLSARNEDIPLLVNHFMQKFDSASKSVSGEALKLLQGHSWPGNIRELENTLERAVILADEDEILPEHISLSGPMLSSRIPDSQELPDEGISLDELEKNYLQAAIKKAGGNKTRAAELLGISRRAIYSKMKTHGLA